MIKQSTFLEYDKENIGKNQQIVLDFIFKNVDLSKIAFCGGIADYLNLREYYDMPVNDVDIIYENEAVLHNLFNKLETKRYVSKFYGSVTGETLVFKYNFGNKSINTDSFPRDFSKVELIQSPLLGTMVWHTSFEECKKNHNNEIPLKTSSARGVNYEWQRLYKHSKKASLYNNISFLEEKNLIHTIKRTIL